MTDREKLDLVFRLCQVPTDTKDKSITAAGRKFHFNDGGPAFPVTDWRESSGMTLRDYFAAAALQGMCAATDRTGPCDAYALDAYAFADAMITEREKI